MTLEEAIAHHRWAAGNCVGEVRDEHLQMVEWLEELVRLRAENAKLRELVKNLHACNGSCPRCIELMGKCEYEEQLREFGIEVDE